jgi:hypothetical protein
MKAKLKTVLNSNVDPFFFVLACVVLFSVSMTAKSLADDVFSAVGNPAGTAMGITADGQVMWYAE